MRRLLSVPHGSGTHRPAAGRTTSLLDSTPTLSPKVALRPEPFGALAYHFGNRRLTFLKRPDLVAVVRALDGCRTLRQVLQACGIHVAQWPLFDEAIGRLVDSQMVLIPEGGCDDQ